MKNSTDQPKKSSKFFHFFRSHPWQSALALFLALIIIATTIGSQMIQTNLSADNFKNALQKQAAEYLTDANQYMNKGDFDRALESVRLFLNLYPDTEEGYLTRASIYTGKGEYQQAVKDMDQLIKLNSKSPEYFLQRGCLYILLNQFDTAEGDFNRAIALDPANKELLLLIAQIYLEKEDYTSALNTYDRYIDEYPDSADIYAQEAYVYSLSEDYEHAAKALQSAYDITPSYAYSSALAQTYAATGSLDETIKYCQLALDEDDSDETLYKLLADTYYLKADYATAATAYTDYLERSPKDEEATYQLCICYLQLNELDQALTTAKELLTFATDETLRKNTQDIVDVLQNQELETIIAE